MKIALLFVGMLSINGLCATDAQVLIAWSLLFNKRLTHQKLVDQFGKKAVFDDSPTIAHLTIHIERVLQLFKRQSANFLYNQYPNEILDQPEVRCCLTALYEKELEENHSGRYTFVHAQQWKWEWFASVYKKLFEITQGTAVGDYQFLRFNRIKNPNKTKEDNIYYNLKNYGRANGFRDRLFFLNAALFANTRNLGSCSFDYWSRNNDASYLRHNTYKVSTQYIFNKFDLAKIYDKYQQELAQLESEHQNLTNRGNLLLVSLSKKLVQSHMYMASCPGYKFSVTIDGSQTDEVIKFIDEIKKAPGKISETDCIEFCLILTKGQTLRPSTDFKIFAFNDIEPEKWAEFCKKRNELFERIKNDIPIVKPVKNKKK